MLEILILFVCASAILSAGGVVGWKLHDRKHLDYKSRWKGAMEMLEDEKLATAELSGVVVPKQINGPTKRGRIDKTLSRKIDSTRDQLERDRLEAGLPPIDPLTNFTWDGSYTAMLKRRYKHGWDENGDPIR